MNGTLTVGSIGLTLLSWSCCDSLISLVSVRGKRQRGVQLAEQGNVVFIADVTESAALENLIVGIGVQHRPSRRLRATRTVASIAVVAGLLAAVVVGVSLRHPAPQAVLPAAFPSSTGLLGYWSADGQTLAGTGPALDGTVGYVDGPSGKAFDLTAGTLSSTALAPVSDAVSVMMWSSRPMWVR